MWCNQAKWVGTGKYYSKDIAKQSRIISLFHIVFAIIQKALSQQPVAQSPWYFHQIKA